MQSIEVMNDEFDETLDDWIDEALKRGEGFKTQEEKDAYLAQIGDPMKHPMFATSAEDMKDHPLTEAFRQLREEDKSFVELAIMYKDEGNDFIKKKSKKDMNEAYDRYSYALTFILKASEARNNDSEHIKDKDVDLNLLRSQILSNRAQASLNIKNYRYCITDCDNAIKFWSSNIKAYFRKAKALLMLKRFDECIEIANRIFDLDPSNKDTKEILEVATTQIESRNKTLRAKIQIFYDQVMKWINVWVIVKNNFNDRISLGYPINPVNPFSVIQREIYPSIDTELNDKPHPPKRIRWPVVFIYPQYNEYDIIESVGSSDMLALHVATVFPEIEVDSNDALPQTPWDIKNEYHVSNLVVYLPLNLSPTITSFEEWIQCYYEICAIEDKDTLIPQEQILAYSDNTTRIDDILSLTERSVVSSKQDKESITQKYFDRIKSNEKQDSVERVVLEVHLGCSMLTLIQTSGNVLGGGIMNLLLFPRGNDAHQQYLRIQAQLGTKFKKLDPNGVIH